VPEVMRCVLLCMLEAVEGGLCLLEALEVVQMVEVIRCVLLGVLDAPEVIRPVLLGMLEAVEMSSICWSVPEVMRCVLGTLYAGDALFSGV